jgi:2-polyprenyl-3-methyl-5-hydroxy-6-metoxy-1,4-benzoquinol methylase
VDTKTHWEKVYTTKAPESVSWYRAHLETSLALIERAAVASSASIIDTGGGESTFVDDLPLGRYTNLTVLDVSQTAIEVTKKRLGSAAEQVVMGDILEIELESRAYDFWHDRTVFLFLTTSEGRRAYVRQVTRAVKPGGHMIVSTFGSEGPTRCSGLEVMRYDAESPNRFTASRGRDADCSARRVGPGNFTPSPSQIRT